MKGEKFVYPFEPGVGGIPTEQFVLPPGSINKPFQGASGGWIRRVADTHRLAFVELFPEHSFANLFKLEANLDGNGELTFGLLSLQIDDKGRKVRHPDFRAGPFVDQAILIFRPRIVRIKGSWVQGQANYADYKLKIREGLGKIDAANQTWTGKAVGRHGFKVRDETEVDDRLVRYVEAVFLPQTISLRQSLLLRLRGLLRR